MARLLPKSTLLMTVLLALALAWIPGPAAARDPVDTCYHYDDVTLVLTKAPCTPQERALQQIKCPVGPPNCIEVLVGIAQWAAGIVKTGGWTVIPPLGASCDVTITPSPWVECDLPSIPTCTQVDVSATGTGSGTIFVAGECAPLVATCVAIINGAGSCTGTSPTGTGNQPIVCRWVKTGLVHGSATCSYR